MSNLMYVQLNLLSQREMSRWLLILLCLWQPVTRAVVKEQRSAQPRFAICLSGQLRRLELTSKIQEILLPNLAAGHELGLFVYLDNATVTRESSSKPTLPGNFFADLSSVQLAQL